jgi:hypothetical protein
MGEESRYDRHRFEGKKILQGFMIASPSAASMAASNQRLCH